MRLSKRAGAALGVLALTAAVFAGGVDGGFLRDDFSLIVHNTFVTDPSLLPEALTSSFWTVSGAETDQNDAYRNVYRPVVTFAWVVVGWASEKDPVAYRVVNLLLHLACVWFAFRWLERRIPKANTLAVFIGAALFALHPSRPESVTWISGSTDLWMTVLIFLGLESWRRRGEHDGWSVMAGILLGLAVLAKEVAIVVPVLLAFDTLLGEDARPRTRHTLAALVPWFLILITRHAIIPFHGSATMVWSIDTGRRVLSTLGHYVALTAWPFEPSVQRALRHALPGGTPFFDPWSIWLGAGTLAVLLLLALGALRYRALRSPVADLTWFFLPLAPVLQVVDLQTYALVSERFIYFPLLGLAALLTRVLPKATVPSIVGGAIVLGACAWTTATHTHHFKSEETLWRHELALRPQNHAALKTLAQIEWNRGNHETALDLDRRGFEAALAIHEQSLALDFLFQAMERVLSRTPDYAQDKLQTLRDTYDGFIDTGAIHLRTDGLKVDFQAKGPTYQRFRKSIDQVRLPRALVTLRTLAYGEAIAQLEKMVQEQPTSVRAWSLLVLGQARSGDFSAAEKALAAMERALPYHPAPKETAKVLAGASMRHAKVDGPITEAMRDADVQLALGSPEGARRRLAPVVAENPTVLPLAFTLARVEVTEHRFSVARQILEAGMARVDEGDKEDWRRALADLARVEGEAGAAKKVR